MKCNKQMRFYRIPVACLWEVHLEPQLWNRVQKAAEGRGCTYSWITRYCVFRLARKKNLRMLEAMKIHSYKVKARQKFAQQYHRHMMCLYGDDEKLIRMAAMQLGVTVSHLIRMALYWFLPKVESFFVKWQEIYYHGTKICRYLSPTRVNILKLPFYDKLFYEKWSPDQWWKRPWVTIPIPYSPIIHQTLEDIQKMNATNN